VVGGDAHGRREFGPVPREAHHARGAAVDSRITPVERELERLGTRAIGPEYGTEIVE
jgi:hypothetical protein